MDEDVEWLLSLYSYVLPYNEEVSGEEFARRIASVHDQDNPKNRYAVRVAKDRIVKAVRRIGETVDGKYRCKVKER